jgi:hypothetical protein
MTIEDRFRALFGVRRGAGADPRDVDLYGPNGDAVWRYFVRVARMTVSEMDALDVDLHAARDDGRDKERAAAWEVALDVARDAGRGAVLGMALDVVWDTLWGPALPVALDSVTALVVWDVLPAPERAALISTWRAVFGEDPGCVPTVAS